MALTCAELTERILDLFPQFALADDWRWDRTEDDEPCVLIDLDTMFTGLADAGRSRTRR